MFRYCCGSIKRMAGNIALQKYKERADLADKIIEELNDKVQILRENAASSVCREEEERLKSENEKLRLQIEKAKIQLILQEVNHGIKQGPLPPRENTQKRDLSTKASPPNETSPPEEKHKKTAIKKEKGDKTDVSKGGKSKKTEKKSSADGGEERMDVSRLDFRIGKIVFAEKHKDADTLYVETVDVGEEKPRTVVSGLVRNVPLEEMQNRIAVFMCNLKPAKMRGILSEAMIMCGVTDEKTEILTPPPGCVPGDRISFDGYPGEPDAMLNPKKKVWETLKPDILVKDQVATYKGVPFKVEGKGIVKSPTVINGKVQ